jgi:hypothetical protein
MNVDMAEERSSRSRSTEREEPPTPQETEAAEGTSQHPGRTLSHTASIGDLTIGELTSIISAEVNRMVASAAIRPAIVAPGGAAGAHVNSGPPGFVNGGGHANFDPRLGVGQFGPRPIQDLIRNVTLPDGSHVSLPAFGPVDLRVRGFHITR